MSLNTMKGVYLIGHGGFDKLQYRENIPKPILSNNEVLRINEEKQLYSVLNPYIKKDNIIIFMGAGSITNWAKNFVLKHE